MKLEDPPIVPLLNCGMAWLTGYGVSTGAGGRVKVQSGPRSLDAWEAAVLALNLPAQQDGVNYDFNSGSYICVPNLYSSSGALQTPADSNPISLA